MKILFIIENLNTDSGWGRYSADLMAALKSNGIEIESESLPGAMRFKRNFLLSWWIALKLFLRHRKNKPYLIHCVVEPYAFTTCLLAFLLKRPYAITLHGTYSILFLEHSFYKFFQARAYKRSSALIAVSHYTKERISRYLNFQNLFVVPNGTSATIKGESKKLGQKIVLLGLGGLKKRKGFHLVVAALGMMKDEIQPFTYYICGTEQDRNYGNHLRALIKENGLEDSIVLTGRISEKEKSMLYEEATIFILTPVSEEFHFEGFGLVYLEANARGIPVIGTFGSGAEEAIKNGYNGFLAKEGDVEDIASKIKEILSREDKYRILSSNALEWAKKMQWKNRINEYLDLYEKINR